MTFKSPTTLKRNYTGEPMNADLFAGTPIASRCFSGLIHTLGRRRSVWTRDYAETALRLPNRRQAVFGDHSSPAAPWAPRFYVAGGVMTQLKKKRKFAFDFRMFAILMILAIGPLSAANWWLLKSHQNIDLEMSGINLADAAEMGFRSVNNFLQQQIRVVAGLTQVPVLRDAIHRGNLDLGKDLEQIRKRIPEFESRWRQLDLKSTELRAILDNPASDFLRRFTEVNKSYHEILVTDSLGRLVAATGKTTQYYLANEYWWKETYGDGRSGSVYVGDDGYDKSAESYSLEMAEPFFEGDRVIGVVRVILDVHEIDSVIGSIYGGSPSSRAALIQAKGKVVSAPGYTALRPKTFPDILKARENGKRFFIGSEEPNRIYGLPSQNFKDLYPHLNWILIASAPVRQVLEPLARLQRHLITVTASIMLLTVLAVLALARVESKPILEEDPHLEKL
jgi:hypothetical protein